MRLGRDLRRAVKLGAALLLMVGAGPAQAAPQWLSPGQTVSGPNSTYRLCIPPTCPPMYIYETAAYPQVIMDGQGNTTAAFGVYDGGNVGLANLMTDTRSAGGSWGSPATLATKVGFASQALAGNPQGDAVLAWVDASGTTVNSSVVKASLRSAGGAFGAPQTISSPGGPSAPVAVAMDPAGDAVAAWNRYDGTGDQIEVATRTAGGSFSSPGVVISGAGHGADYAPAVAMDTHGDAIAVWDQTVGGQIVAEASIRPAGGSFGTPQVISATGAGVPVVAMDAQGDAVALWSRYNGSQSKFEVAVRPAGGSFPSTGTVVSGAGASGYPQISLDAQGNATAAWMRDPGTGPVVETSFRPAGGSFPAGGTAVSQSGVASDALTVDAAGNAYLAWSRYDSTSSPATYKIEGSSRPPGGSFSTPVVVKSVDNSGGESEQLPHVAADGAGNGVAIWADFNQSTESVLASGFDGAGPQLRNLSIPSTGTANQPVTDSVSPVDVWSSVPSTSWDFGDGSSAAPGASVSHGYAAAGTYHVSVTSTDALGNASTATGTVTVSAAPLGSPGSPGPPGTKVPALSSVTMTNRVFVVGPGPTAVSAAAKPPRGTAFKYTLSAAATVRIQIQRPMPGRKSHGKCVKPTKKLRKKPSCTRYVTVGALTRHGSAGANSVPFSGRIGRHPLAPGRYVATVTASNSAGGSQPKRLTFQVVRSKRNQAALDLF